MHLHTPPETAAHRTMHASSKEDASSPPHTDKGSRKKSIAKRIVYYSGAAITFLAVGGFLFIKLNTGAAATFADQALRPAIGDNQVIFLEGIYFQMADLFDRIKYSIVKPPNLYIASGSIPISAPQMQGQAVSSTLALSPIAVPGVTPADGAGVWRNIPLDLFPGQIVMADTFVNPDPSRPYAFVTLVQMDMSRLRLSSVAGTQEPGAKAGKPGPGIIPRTVQESGALVAAFNGGFQYRDGRYGMIVGKTTYLPLKKDLATLVAYADGTLRIVKYEGQDLGTNIVFIRQNCPMLIENGVVASNDQANKKLWGRTVSPGIYTWRSGIGITASGTLVYAVGNSLTPATLATALQAAGAVNAMQLDINPFWVRFNVFDHFASGTYTHFTVMNGIQDGAYQYLHGYQKDFFYVTKA